MCLWLTRQRHITLRCQDCSSDGVAARPSARLLKSRAGAACVQKGQTIALFPTAKRLSGGQGHGAARSDWRKCLPCGVRRKGAGGGAERLGVRVVEKAGHTGGSEKSDGEGAGDVWRSS